MDWKTFCTPPPPPPPDVEPLEPDTRGATSLRQRLENTEMLKPVLIATIKLILMDFHWNFMNDWTLQR